MTPIKERSREVTKWMDELNAILGLHADEKSTGQTASQLANPAEAVRGRGEEPNAQADQEALTTKAGATEALLGIPIPDPIDVKIDILNHSPMLLRRVPGSAKCDAPLADFANGKEPPAEIAASPGAANIEVVVKVPLIGVAFPNDADGEVTYEVDDAKKTKLRARWVRPVIGSRKTVAEVKPTNRDYGWKGDFVGDHFTFTFSASGGPGPKPQPGPSGATSCLVTVINKTKQTLSLLRQVPDKGDFVESPESSLAPGASCHFVYAATPNAKEGEEGCKALVVWDVGTPSVAVWRIEWDNPTGAKNTVNSNFDPPKAPFRSLDQIGQGEENVPVTFTLIEQGAGPGPGPGPDGPEPEFKPPVPPGNPPTFRLNDKSADGWIEYMQQLLRDNGFSLKVDGIYGPATQKAIIAFQTAKGLKVDGICGNETWSVLREGVRQAVGTDGRTPHTFIEHGQKARWQREGEHCVLLVSEDEGRLLLNSVGDVPGIDKMKATVRVTPLGSKPKTVEIEIGAPNQRMDDNQGNVHIVKLKNFRKTFKIGDREATDAELKLYVIEAYLEQSLGGDFIKTSIVPI